MPSPVFRVFVSSTWKDLEPERAAVRDAVLGIKETQFVGMEHFGSRDETTRRASLDEVDGSEIYLGIFAARYGSGITEAEYRRARENKLPCLVYFKDDATVPDHFRETDPAQTAKLDALKAELKHNHLVTTFKTPDALAARLTADLHRWLFANYLPTKLEAALRNELPRDKAQALLDAVKDLSQLNRDLLTRLKAANFNVASGERSVAYTGDAGQVNINTGDTHVHNVAAPPLPTLHQLRAPVGDFVGREKEIAELTETLRGGTSAAISGISGMGGIGKTELVLYVANQLRDAYPDAQLVVDMRGTDDPPRDPSDALAACVRAFVGIEKKLPDDPEELTRLYRNALEGKRALILLDNAHDSAQVRPLLPPAGSALLITSRNAITLPRMRRVTLEQLSPAEARELLTGITPRVPEDVADQICFLCGYLPLAIRAAGSLLDVTIDLDPAVYAAQLRDERRRLELIGAEGVDTSVEASLGLSYARLSPDAARVFRQLAVFPVTFDAAAEEAVCEDPGHKHLTDLLRRSLVLYNPDTRRYRLHDLARLFATSRLTEDERRTSQIHHASHYLKVLWECDEVYLRGGEDIKNSLALFEVERRNIDAGQEWVSHHVGEDETIARLCCDYPRVGPYVLMLRQHPRERIAWLKAAVLAARQLKDRAAESKHMNSIGIVYSRLGEPQRAIELHEQCLAIARQMGDLNAEGMALGNLGIAFQELGEPRRAIEFHEQSLAITRDIGNRLDEAENLDGLGRAYAALGEMRRAIEFYEQRLAISREMGDRRGESYTLGNLGNAYLQLGETPRALELFNAVLIVAREMGDRYSEGNSLFAICVAFDKLGERAQAIANAEAALEIFEQHESLHAELVREILAEWRGEA